MILFAIALAALPRPNIVLITIDTLRADHLGSYGSARGSTPALDAIERSEHGREEAIAPKRIAGIRPSSPSEERGERAERGARRAIVNERRKT